MVTDETLDKLGVTLLVLTILNILGLIAFIVFSAYNESDFSEEISSLTIGSYELIINLTNICYFDVIVIIVQLIFLFIVSNKKVSNM